MYTLIKNVPYKGFSDSMNNNNKIGGKTKSFEDLKKEFQTSLGQNLR